MIELSNEQKYWAVIGGAALVVFLGLVIWALPAWSGARSAEQDWQERVDKLELLRLRAKKIPSAKALQERQEYGDWLEEQAREVEDFFYDRSRILGDALPGEVAEISPAQFKEAYIRAVRNELASLSRKQRLISISAGDKAYPVYDWQTGSSLPKQADFANVLLRYWAHYYVYAMFIDSNVRVVRELRISNPVPLTAGLQGMNVQANLVMYPDDARNLVRHALAVSSGERKTSKPIIRLKSLKILPESGGGAGPVVNVLVEGYVLLFPPREAP